MKSTRRAWGAVQSQAPGCYKPAHCSASEDFCRNGYQVLGWGWGWGWGWEQLASRQALWVVSHLQARSQDFTHYLLHTLHPIQFWHLPDQILTPLLSRHPS